MSSNYLVIADDFTGANDSGVQMRNKGIPVKVFLNLTEEIANSSIVIDTESRNINPEESYQKVKNMVNPLVKANPFDLIFKKIDSTLRGNIVEEVKAVDEFYQADKIIIAPAFPETKRTTYNGIQKLRKTPLMKTEFAKDVLSPIQTDNIIKMFEDGFNKSVTHHNLKSLNKDVVELEGSKFHTFDALKSTDLNRIASLLLDSPHKILWVGSSGLATALFEVLSPSKPGLAVVGSVSEQSFRQISYAEQKGIEVLKISNEDLFNKERINTVAKTAINLLNTKEQLIVTPTKSIKDYESTLEYAKVNGITSSKCSWHVQNYLAELTKQIVSEIDLSGVFLSGGGTAVSVVNALGTSVVEIKEELYTGIVHSVLSDGLHQGMNIITKAGAFGEVEDLFNSLEKIKEMTI